MSAHEDWFDLVISPEQLNTLLAVSGPASDKQLLKYLRHFLEHSQQYDGKEQGSESHQSQMLLAMSAKIFARLHYSLARIAQKLPLVLAHRLMLWLCAACGLPDPYLAPADRLEQLPSARWVYQLYHRWVLRCLVEDSYIKKPPRSMVQGVAGITDRTTEQLHACAQSRDVAAHLASRVERSLECLAAELPATAAGGPERAARPAPSCYRLPTLAEPDAAPDWSDSQPVSDEYCRCLVHFELGQYYFMQRRYSQAFDHFTAAGPAAATSGEEEVPDEDEAEVPVRLLDAYLTAIRSASRQSDARPPMLQRLDLCRARHWGGLAELLLEDLTSVGRGGRPLLPDIYWDLLAGEVAASDAVSAEVKFQVRTCRLVRRAADDACSVLDYPQLLAANGSRGVRFLVNAAAAAAAGGEGAPPRQPPAAPLLRLLRYLLGQLRPPPRPADVADWPWPTDDLLSPSCDLDDGDDVIEGDFSDDVIDDSEDYDDDVIGDDVTDAGVHWEEEDDEEAFFEETEAACGRTSDDLRLLASYRPAEVATLAERLCRHGPGGGWTPQTVAGLCRAWQPHGSQGQQPLHHHAGGHRQLPQTPAAAVAAVLSGKAAALQLVGEFDLARRLLTHYVGLAGQQQQHLLLLDLRRWLTAAVAAPAPPPELLTSAEAALRQLQDGGNSSNGYSEELAVLGSCLLLCAGRLPPQSAGGSGGGPQQHHHHPQHHHLQQQPGASNYCVDFARLLMLASADREAKAAAASAGGGGAAALTGQKAPSHADLWARVGRLFIALGAAKRSAGPGSGPAPGSGSTPAELGFAKRCLRPLLRWLRSEAHIDLLLSLLVKLTCLACNDLNVPVHSSCPELWPDQLPARFTTQLQRAGLRRALRDLLDSALRTQPANVSWLVTRADLAFADHEPGLALRCYLEAAIAASELFERPLPIQLFGDEALRRMARCCEQLGMRSCAGVLAQCVPDQASAIRLLADPSSPELPDAVLPYLWDLSLLEIVTSVGARRGALAKRDKFVRAARAMELNSCNRPDLLHEVETAKRAEFLRALASLVFGSV